MPKVNWNVKMLYITNLFFHKSLIVNVVTHAKGTKLCQPTCRGQSTNGDMHSELGVSPNWRPSHTGD